MNGVCSYMGHTHTHSVIYIYIYIKFPKPPRACLQQLLKVLSQSDERCVLLYGTQTHTKTLIFIYRLNFQNYRELRRNQMNRVCSCATPCTPASTIFKFFKFPKPPRECLQQLVKVSSQSDEECLLLYGTDKQTDRHTDIDFYI